MGLLVEPAAKAAVPLAEGLLENGVPCSSAQEPSAAPAPAGPPKSYYSYDSIHQSIVDSLAQLQAGGFDRPDYLLAISGGGLIPARVLRSVLRSRHGGCAAIKVIGLELYDDEVDGTAHADGVKRTQWLDLGDTLLAGKRILLVDEVDDTRQTLAYAVRELRADIAAQEAELAAGGRPAAQPTRLGVFVIHCKDKPKEGQLPDDVPHFVAQDVEGDPWIVYPWDAEDIAEHNRLGQKQ